MGDVEKHRKPGREDASEQDFELPAHQPHARGGNAVSALEAERHEMRAEMVRALAAGGLDGESDGALDEATVEARREQMLHLLRELRETVNMANEVVLRMGEDALHHAAAHALHLGHHDKIGTVRGVDPHEYAVAARLSAAQSHLTLLEGVLRLTGPEMVETARANPGVWGVVLTSANVIRGATEIIAGTVGTIAAVTELLARATGDAALANAARGLTVGTVATFGKIFSAVQVIHGIYLVLEKGASLEQKVEGAGEIASGGGFLAGAAIGGSLAGGLISAPLYFVVRAVGEVLLAHERGERASWKWNYIDQIATTLAQALVDGYVTPEQSGGGTEQWEARRAAFVDAIAILKIWGPAQTHAIGRELSTFGNGLRRALRSEIAASAGMPLDETSAMSRFRTPPRPAKD
jgi:hypothetical protein